MAPTSPAGSASSSPAATSRPCSSALPQLVARGHVDATWESPEVRTVTSATSLPQLRSGPPRPHPAAVQARPRRRIRSPAAASGVGALGVSAVRTAAGAGMLRHADRTSRAAAEPGSPLTVAVSTERAPAVGPASWQRRCRRAEASVGGSPPGGVRVVALTVAAGRRRIAGRRRPPAAPEAVRTPAAAAVRRRIAACPCAVRIRDLLLCRLTSSTISSDQSEEAEGERHEDADGDPLRQDSTSTRSP